MSCIVMAIAVDDATVDPLGAKEAVAMALEPLGQVRVFRMEVREPEQLGLDGVAPMGQTVTPIAVNQAKVLGGQAPAGGAPAQPKRTGPRPLVACVTCGCFRESHGRDGHGTPYWGICRETGKPVYDLKAQCGAWKGAT